MEDDARRVAPLVAYAAAVCGGVFACLLLLGGTAQADSSAPESESSHGLLDVDRVGEQVGAVTRDVGRGAADVVTRATQPVAPDVAAVERTTQRVVDTTDRVADGVERVTRAVEDGVDEPEPTPPAGPPLTAAPQDGADDSTPAADDRAERPQRDTAVPDGARAVQTDETVPRGVRTTRTAPDPAPAPTHVDTSPPAGSAPEVPAPAPFPLGAGCDDCEATGTSSGDLLHVLGLPAHGVPTPRIAGTVLRDAGVGGPAPLSRRPDVSPD